MTEQKDAGVTVRYCVNCTEYTRQDMNITQYTSMSHRYKFHCNLCSFINYGSSSKTCDIATNYHARKICRKCDIETLHYLNPSDNQYHCCLCGTTLRRKHANAHV